MSDFHGIRDWVNDRLVTSDLTDSHIFDHIHTEAETYAFLDSTFLDDPKDLKLAIADSQTNEYLGQINVFNIDDSRGSCAFDIVIRRRYWRKGIALNAVNALMNERHAKGGISTFEAQVKKSNHAARALFRKLGFRMKTNHPDRVELVKTIEPTPRSGI